jgi:hypothetical protein
MLSLRQFKQKHARKFQGLTKAEISSRYIDYMNQANEGGMKVRKTPQLNARGQIVSEQPLGKNMSYKVMVAPCTALYTKALTNAFGKFEELPCIPDTLSLPSYKYKAWCRGSFTVGDDQVGYVAVAPFIASNTGNAVIYTLPGNTLTSFQPAVAAGQTAAAVTNSPFSQAQLQAPGVEYRIVGSAIRASYISSEFARAGLVILHRTPSNQAIPGGSTGAALLLNVTTAASAATREYQAVHYRPDTPTQLGYIPYPNDAAHGLLLAFYVEGGTPGTVWEWEYVQFVELIGPIGGQVTPSHSDPVGMGAALGSLPNTNSVAPPAVTYAAVMKETAVNISKASSQILPVLKGIGAGLKAGYDLYSGNYSAALEGVKQSAYERVESPVYLGLPASTGPIITEID